MRIAAIDDDDEEGLEGRRKVVGGELKEHRGMSWAGLG